MEDFEYKHLDKCPGGYEELVSKYLNGQIPKTNYSWIEDHIEDCEVCSGISKNMEEVREVAKYLRFGFTRFPDALEKFRRFRTTQKLLRTVGVGNRKPVMYAWLLFDCFISALLFIVPVLKSRQE